MAQTGTTHSKPSEAADLHAAVDPLGTTNLRDRIQAILSLTTQLTALITAETNMLKSRRGSSLRETEDEKRRLSALYAREMRAIKARPELLAGATPKQKEILRTASSAFRACIATHVRTLARVRAVTEAMVVAIGEELSLRQQPVTSYKRPGAPALNRSSSTLSAPAFGFDHSV